MQGVPLIVLFKPKTERYYVFGDKRTEDLVEKFVHDPESVKLRQLNDPQEQEEDDDSDDGSSAAAEQDSDKETGSDENQEFYDEMKRMQEELKYLVHEPNGNVDSLIKEHKYVLGYFHSETCEYCPAYDSIVAHIAKTLNNTVYTLSVNCDNENDACTKILGEDYYVPKFVLFKDGQHIIFDKRVSLRTLYYFLFKHFAISSIIEHGEERPLTNEDKTFAYDIHNIETLDDLDELGNAHTFWEMTGDSIIIGVSNTGILFYFIYLFIYHLFFHYFLFLIFNYLYLFIIYIFNTILLEKFLPWFSKTTKHLGYLPIKFGFCDATKAPFGLPFLEQLGIDFPKEIVRKHPNEKREEEDYSFLIFVPGQKKNNRDMDFCLMNDGDCQKNVGIPSIIDTLKNRKLDTIPMLDLSNEIQIHDLPLLVFLSFFLSSTAFLFFSFSFSF